MPSQLPTQSPSVSDDAFDTTKSIEIKRTDALPSSNEFAATQMATAIAPLGANSSGKASESNAGAAGFAHSDVGFSTSKLFAISSDEMATDPELEEAAIRFANGDDAGAEQGLLAALRGNQLQPEAAQSWAAAVLDLYRATGAKLAFDSAAQEFALHLNGLVPTWVSFTAGGDVNASSQTPVPARPAGPGTPLWNCPSVLDAQGMASLQDCMGMYSMPWHLGWADLSFVDDSAAPLLDKLFSSLSDEPVSVVFSGSQALVLALRSKTPPGERSTDVLWWQIRLNALRVMRLQDDFELAALDYCITHEVAPPAWVNAQCQYDDLGHVDATANSRPDPGPATVPLADNGSPTLALRGELRGDASELLAAMEKNEVPGVKLVVSCEALLRVDFAAAGSILNWVAIRQAEGKQIQFQNAHRLVAAFFNVIGINEHAKVIPRPV
jgi:ABC-type transporter Mla MlaB component